MDSDRQFFFARIAVFAFVAVVCFWKLGAMPLLETDEGFAANRAMSFYRHDTWRLSYDDVDDDNPQFRKPPLLYWAVAALYPALGRNEWAVRLPVAASALWLCWILYRIARRHFGEATALGSVLLFACVPFVVHHMRTAMLEMPLLALTFAAVYCLAYLGGDEAEAGENWFHRLGIGTALLGGLAAAGAVLTKGSPGFLAIAVAVVCSLVFNRFSKRSLVRALVAVAVVGVVFFVYAHWIVPHRWQDAMLTSMFVKEGTRRTRDVEFLARFGRVSQPLWATAPFLIILAGVGLLAGIWRCLRPLWKGGLSVWKIEEDAVARRAFLLWIPLMLLMCVPVIWVGAKQVVPYARYFLPVYPFLAMLAAFAIVSVARHRYVAAFVLVAAGALTFFWPTARECHPGRHEMPMPGMKEIAQKVPAYVMEGDKVILAAGKIKCHQLLFFGQRAIISEKKWLLEDFKPGAIRYAIARSGWWWPAPYVVAEKLDESGPFELLRLSVVTTGRRDIAGILLCTPKDREALAAELKKQGRAFEAADTGFLLLKDKQDEPPARKARP